MPQEPQTKFTATSSLAGAVLLILLFLVFRAWFYRRSSASIGGKILIFIYVFLR